MSDLGHVGGWLEEQVPLLLEKYGVPSAAWAVLKDGEVVDGAAGLLSTATGVEATADSVFQIGSITKLWTASLVMQLVDEGLVDLEAPVQTYLPALTTRDTEAAARMTVRQLLDHTAGFEGDIFTDTGVGDDAVEKYLPELADLAQLFPPGERFSYNNAGYCVLGRLVEVLREKSYDACLREHLIAPLGLTHAATDAYQAIMFRAAVGHVDGEDGPQPAPVWAMARSNAPAGSMLSMRARDLVTFARMHLEDGRAADGTQVLQPGTSARMQERQVDLPHIGMMGTSWGLGFERFDGQARAVVGHDGNTIGQAAFLRMVPEAGLAVVLLSNGGDAFSLYREVVGRVLEELGGLAPVQLPQPPAHPEPVDASRLVGTYSAEVYDLVVTQDDEQRVWVETVPKGFLLEMGETGDKVELVSYDGGDGTEMLIPLKPDRGMHMPHAFLGDDGEGHARYLFLGRIVRRAGA